jgi:hypothetical protein
LHVEDVVCDWVFLVPVRWTVKGSEKTIEISRKRKLRPMGVETFGT